MAVTLSRRTLLGGLVAGTLGASALGGVIAASSSSSSSSGEEPPSDDQATEPSGATATAERRTLSQSKEFNAQISYGEEFSLPTTAQGVVTARPEKGSVVEPGDELFRVGNKPVFLAQGYLPMYRELKKTPDVKVKGEKYMRGYDVAHLQQFLIDAGFDAAGELAEPTGEFDPDTEKAVKAWQKSVGHTVTGRVDRTQLVIHHESVRVASTMHLGADFQALMVTPVAQQLTFNVASRDRRLVDEGGSVQIEASDGGSVEGTVTALERSIDDQGSSVVKATVTPMSPLSADVSTAVVTATEVLVEDALVVPVRALLAVSQGGFAVEMAERTSAGGARLVRVEVGEVADGFAEITGAIEDGDRVAVAE